MTEPVTGSGTKDDPWVLRTPAGQSAYLAYRDPAADPPTLVCVVGKTTLGYQLRCLEDLHAMLISHDDWMALRIADEQEPSAQGTVEAWARSPENPVGGWYGLKKGLRGRFANYVPPVMELPRARRTGAQPAQQPHARPLTRSRKRSGAEPP
jgi:hypothetical protein